MLNRALSLATSNSALRDIGEDSQVTELLWWGSTDRSQASEQEKPNERPSILVAMQLRLSVSVPGSKIQPLPASKRKALEGQQILEKSSWETPMDEYLRDYEHKAPSRVSAERESCPNKLRKTFLIVR